jgi:Dolichyl-phosphate-mannose-protein mannosyltransferase
MSSVAVPVYLWGRSLMRPLLALGAAALTLAAPALAFTGFIMTEVAFYPVLILAAWASTRALARPTPRAQVLAVAAILLAVLTRLHALVLLPAFFLAVAIKVAFDRSWLRGVRPFAPAAVATGVVAAGWLAFSRIAGGSTLGVYRVTGEVGYNFGDALRFTLYHAGDVVLMTAVAPVAALVLLAFECAARRERAPEVRAFIAVAIAFSALLVASVGVFTSRFLARLAERNLIGLAPILFLALMLWVDRGAPRRRVALAVASAVCLGALLTVPWNDLVTRAARPDALSLIPLYELRTAYPELDLTLLLAVGALEVLAVLVLVPRRFLWLVPITLAALFVGSSVLVTREAARDARAFHAVVVGAENRWIDSAVDGPVAYVYGGEQPGSGGAAAWMNAFWNRRVETVYALFGSWIAGPMPPHPVRPTADGLLVSPDGRPVEEPYAVISRRMTIDGDPIATTESGMGLWRVRGPLRLSTRTSGLDATGLIAVEGRLLVYRCTGGELRLALASPVAQTVDIVLDGRTVRRPRLRPGGRFEAVIPAPPPETGRCVFKIIVEQPLRAERLDFVRSA